MITASVNPTASAMSSSMTTMEPRPGASSEPRPTNRAMTLIPTSTTLTNSQRYSGGRLVTEPRRWLSSASTIRATMIDAGPHRPIRLSRLFMSLTACRHQIVEVNAHRRQQHPPDKPQHVAERVAADLVDEGVASRGQPEEDNGRTKQPEVSPFAGHVLVKPRDEEKDGKQDCQRKP